MNEKQRRPYRRTIIVLSVLAAALFLCAGLGALMGDPKASDETDAPPATETAAAAAAPAPYELVEEGDLLTMRVTTDHTGELGAAFRELAHRVVDTYPEDGYFVQVDCAIEGQAGRLGNGKIAVGSMGAARTGLPVGGHHIAWLPGKHCQPGYVEPAFDPDRKLDNGYALELCRGRVEDRYTADQVPVTLSGVEVTESEGRWTVTGQARGRATVPGSATAAVEFTCEARVNSGGTLMVNLSQFDY